MRAKFWSIPVVGKEKRKRSEGSTVKKVCITLVVNGQRATHIGVLCLEIMLS